MSQARASSQPAPSAYPFTAARTGFFSRSIPFITAWTSFRKLSASAAPMSLKAGISAPAAKAFGPGGGLQELPKQPQAQGVHDLRAVQRDGGDPGSRFVDEMRVLHVASPSRRCKTPARSFAPDTPRPPSGPAGGRDGTWDRRSPRTASA